MPSNKRTLISGKMKSALADTISTMNWLVLATLFFVSTCLADESASDKRRNTVEEMEDNIRLLRQAKEQLGREERQKNSLAALTDVIIKDSFDSQLMSKMDILYDNQTDLSKELKFVPQVFNCGKEFDIFKVLELAKAHKNITTEQPPCIMDEDDDMCSTKKSNGMANNNKGTKTTYPQWKETPGVVRAFALQSAISTRIPSVPPPYGRRTELAFIRQSTINPLAKTGKSENREKPSPIGKEAGRKTSPNHLQKHSDSKGFVTNPPLIYRKFTAVPSLGDFQMEENPPISEDQPQSWYAPEVAQYEQYPSIENQNENDIEVKLQEPRANGQKSLPESFKEQIKGAKKVQMIQQQSQVFEQTPPSQVVEQSQMQNVAMGGMVHQKQSENQPGLKEKKAALASFIVDNKKQDFEKNGVGGVIQAQQPPQQGIKINKQPPAQQIFTQPQVLEQKHFNQQTSEKQIQQQPQPLDFQNQQQQQTIEQRIQQPFQTLERPSQQQTEISEKQNTQQTETLEKQYQQQFLNAEQQKQLHSQSAEQQKQQFQTAQQQKQQFQTAQQQKQQLQTIQQQKQQPFQIAEQQKQLQLQTVEQPKHQQLQTVEQPKHQQLQTVEQQKQQPFQTTEQNQFQTMERHYTQHRTSGKYGQPQFQIIEKQSPIIMPPVTLSGHQQPAPGSEQQQVIQKTSQSIYDQQQILYPQRIEQNQQADKPITNPITSAQQAPQVPEPQTVAKLPSIAPNRAVLESSTEKLLNSNFDKTMMPAPINVIVMEPNLNFPHGTPTSKSNLITGNIPATGYFWDYTIGNTPKVQNYDSFKTEQNKSASVPNQHSSDIPGSFQENSRGDYLYYQDQD